METPKQKEKMQKNPKKVTNLFEDTEYHAFNQKSYNKMNQGNMKKGKSSQKV
jgi:hypothetical protein